MEVNSVKELFNKYVLVWIWSIFVSINTALSYNIFNIYEAGKWAQLTIFLIPLYILAAFTAVSSWYSLFNFFKVKILPLVLSYDPHSRIDLDNVSNIKSNLHDINDFVNADENKKSEVISTNSYKESALEEDRYAYIQLKNSFNFIIFAIFFRFLIPIVEMIFDLLYR